MTKGWYGQKQRHSMSAKGIKSSDGIWFESKGVLTEVVSLFNMFGLGDMFSSGGDDKKEAKGLMACGYTERTYSGDASMVVLLPSSRAEDSIEWLKEEYLKAETPHRRIQLQRLIRMTLYRIKIELKEENPEYVDNQLKESYRMYDNLLSDIEYKQRRVYA